jgi:hypothetical protein
MTRNQDFRAKVVASSEDIFECDHWEAAQNAADLAD